jgi:hypothetical protein
LFAWCVSDFAPALPHTAHLGFGAALLPPRSIGASEDSAAFQLQRKWLGTSWAWLGHVLMQLASLHY